MPTTPRRLAVGLLTAAAATALLSGCTDDGAPTGTTSASPTASTRATTDGASPTASAESVAQVYRAARTASLSAGSGHAVGTLTREDTPLRIDVEGKADGTNQTVFITTPDGGTAEVLTIGDHYWVGGDEAYWAEITGDPKTAPSMVGKYAPIMESDATELGTFTLRTLLTDTFAQPDFAVLESDTGEATRAEVGGQPAYVLGREGGARLWVAADGSGTLLRVVGPKSDPSDLRFSDWDRARTFSAPAPADLVED